MGFTLICKNCGNSIEIESVYYRVQPTDNFTITTSIDGDKIEIECNHCEEYTVIK